MMRRPVLVPLHLLVVLITLLWAGAWVCRGSPVSAWFDLASWTVAGWGSAALALHFYKGSRPGGTGAALRRGLLAALGVNGLSQLAFDLGTLGAGPPWLWASGVLYLLVGPLVLAAYRSSWVRSSGDRRIPGLGLDTALLCLGVLALVSALVLPNQEKVDWTVLVSTILFPLGLFTAFGYGLLLTLHDPAGTSLPGRWAGLGALLGLGIIQMLWGLVSLSGFSGDGSPLNLVSSFFLVLLGWSSGQWTWSRHIGVSDRKASLLILLPVVSLVTSLGALFLAVTDPRMPAWSLPLFGVLAVALGILALARQWTLARSLRQVRIVKAKNQDLERALAQLQETQDHLIQSAKLAALGQMVAGIAHDLNSPLGAIRSSSALMIEASRDLAGPALDRVEALSVRETEVFRSLLDALSPKDPILDSRAERALRRRWALRAEALGHQDPGLLAQGLVDAGLGDREDVVEPFLELGAPERVLAALEPYATAFRLAAVVHLASDKASDVVVALHNFLRGGDQEGKRWVEVSASIRGVLPLFQHRVHLGTTLVPSLSQEALVHARPEKLSQVWVNLLTNAFQAVSPGGRVEVEARRVDNEVVVTVTDDGPGIPPETQDKIFEAFFTTKPAGEGTGLGLDVCRRVVEELGGTIGFESRPGLTVFEVRLPLGPVPTLADRV